jgi:hypothetical protein
VISWGGTRGDWGGGTFAPPSLYVKKGPDIHCLKSLRNVKVAMNIYSDTDNLNISIHTKKADMHAVCL